MACIEVTFAATFYDIKQIRFRIESKSGAVIDRCVGCLGDFSVLRHVHIEYPVCVLHSFIYSSISNFHAK